MPSDVCREYGKNFCECSATVRWKFFITLALLWIAAAPHVQGQGPSEDFSAHTLVRPKVYHGRSKRAIFNTRKSDDPLHEDVLTVGFELDGQQKILDLRLNTELIPVGYKQRHQHNGGYKTEEPKSVELCHYQGRVRSIRDSWVAVSTCNGLRGVVFDGQELHHIEPADEKSLNATHYVYKHSHLVANNTCGYEGTRHDIIEETFKPEIHRASRYKRAAETVIRGPYNANRQSRYVELVLVIDKKEYVALGENLDKVHHHCKDIANIINALYTPLNIFVALVGVEVWTDSDEITLSSKGDTTLRNFLNYRREMLVKKMPNDNAQLLTKVHFEDGVVGKALKGPICTYEFSGGVSMDHSNVIGLVAATMAHEMGHNFGMEHDSADCSCPEDRCIMAPSSGSTGPVHWSSCSLEYLARAFEHGMDYCLRNKPQKLFDSPICGNGFVEPGEQCDCGLREHCDNPCCNATACMLYSNASCATGECCDLRRCRPKNAGTECRSAEHECDLPEYCTGQSEYCPVDVFKIDGESCNMGRAFCYQGTCRTHNDQCKLLWGPTGSSSDAQCYDMNNKGTKHGNCGYNRLNESFVRCNDENILCGMLHCKHLNERLEFGMESVAILSHSFINNGGKIIACRSAMVDLGLNQVDPGLAPDGAKCAPGKMCVNQKCLPIDDLRRSIAGTTGCPNDCGGNGVCNSLGHCHCNRGFHPPDCVQPGFGGSDDSGPAEDPNARTDFITALYIVFLGVVPTMALVSLAVWYAKNNPNRHWKKEAISTNDRGNAGCPIKTIDRPRPRSIDTIDSTLSQDPACASLLPKNEPDERFNNNLFGQFKGFTLSALPTAAANKSSEPSKPAPPPPTLPTVAIKTNVVKPTQRTAAVGINALESRRAFFNSATLSKNYHESSTRRTEEEAPALPPLNPGCTARPLISSPVLAATTCTSMELIAAKLPTRPAPDIPSVVTSASAAPATCEKPPRPNSTPLVNVVLTELEKKASLPPEKRSNPQQSTLNRIASILRAGSSVTRTNSQPPLSQTLPLLKDDKSSSNSLPRRQHQKANKVIDKEILRNLEISHPIPQKQMAEIPSSVVVLAPIVNSDVNKGGSLKMPNGDNSAKRPVVMRAQSMRDEKVSSARTVAAIHTFGSMRQANPAKRPSSIPASARPTCPPPPVPPVSGSASAAAAAEKTRDSPNKIPGLPGYQNPPVRTALESNDDDAYDDCMNLAVETPLKNIIEESPSNDNIYAVIEESIPEKMRKKAEPGRIVAGDAASNEYKAPKPIVEITGNAGGGNSDPGMGLLSEIVSEISSRNLDSIYSTSTLARKKKEREMVQQRADKSLDDLGSNSSISTYANSSNHYKSPDSIYSNSPSGKFNSASSTTSSGYLNPSALNVPRQRLDEARSNASAAIDDDKLDSLNSGNPNVSDAMSKALGIKPADDGLATAASRTTIPARPNDSLPNSSNKIIKVKGKPEIDPCETKDSPPPSSSSSSRPNLGKPTTKRDSSVRQSPTSNDRSSSSEQIRTNPNNPPLKAAKKFWRHDSVDTSLVNKVPSPTKTHFSNSSNKRRNDHTANAELGKKINNSPDLVSSCSNASSTKTSPDVTLGSNSGGNEIHAAPASGQKTTSKAASSATIASKTASAAPAKSAVAASTANVQSTKTSNFAERKKSPSATSPTTLAESQSIKFPGSNKLASKNDARSNETRVTTENTVQKASSGKSNVASLQKKFEINRAVTSTTTATLPTTTTPAGGGAKPYRRLVKN